MITSAPEAPINGYLSILLLLFAPHNLYGYLHGALCEMEIISKNFDGLDELCRLCLSNAGDRVALFGEHSEDLTSRIYECVAVQVSPGDGFPRYICGSCSDYIAGWTTFKEHCKRIDSILQKHVKQTKHSKVACAEIIDQECVDKLTEHNEHEENEDVTEQECGQLCGKCGNTQTGKNTFSFHMCDLGLGSGHRFVCNICGKDYSTKGAVRTHLQMHKGKHRCGTCGKCFPSRFQVEVHARKHTGDRLLVCEYCGCTFAHNRSLLMHIMTAHTAPAKAQLYCCPQCDYRTPSRSYLESHTAVHTESKPYVCEICGRGYTLISSLTTHQANHSDSKLFECVICSKGFQTRRKLVSHIVVHSTVRPFHCEDCGKRFTRKKGLKEHRVIHTGEKRFNCPKCHKSFAWRKVLRTHKCAPEPVSGEATM